MKFSLASIVAFAALAIAAPTSFDDPATSTGPDPSKVWINGIKYGGSGCPAGSVTGVITQDRSAFTLIMEKYGVQIYDGNSPAEWTKQCQLNVDLQYPSGWQYSIFTATYRGSAVLDKGVSGTQQATYYFTGASSGQQCKASTTIKGPYNDNYAITDTIALETTVWSPCGALGLLNLASTVRIARTGKGQSGVLTTDSIDGNFKQLYGLQWRKC